MSNFFDKEKFMIYYKNLQLYLRLGLKLRKIYPVLFFSKSQSLKLYVEFNTHKKVEAEKNGDKDGKALYKLINNAVFGKTIENVRNRINVKLVSNKRHYLKWTSKPNYMSQKIFDSELVAIHKNKVPLTFKKSAYTLECA